MRRRDFLRTLGIGAFACAVNNVPKVLSGRKGFIATAHTVGVEDVNEVSFTVSGLHMKDRVFIATDRGTVIYDGPADKQMYESFIVRDTEDSKRFDETMRVHLKPMAEALQEHVDRQIMMRAKVEYDKEAKGNRITLDLLCGVSYLHPDLQVVALS